MKNILKSMFIIIVFIASSLAKADDLKGGDTIQGYQVIDSLDLNRLQKGKIHYFLFKGVEMGTGQYWYVPVMVAKGVNEGKRLLLTSGVHGDETSPVGVLHTVFNTINPEQLSGTVIAILDISRPSTEFVQRKWPLSSAGSSLSDMNRVWPGKEFGNAAERQAWLVFEKLIKGNADIAVDFHTASTGIDFAWFIFADYRNAESKRLAELFPVDQIKDDPGVAGTLETTLIESGIPAITVEVGGPRHFDKKLIQASVDGVMNILADYAMSNEKVGKVAKDTNFFFGNKLDTIVSKTGGYVEMLVDLGDQVKAGQKIAIQRNFFGKTTMEYFSNVNGMVSIIARDALREPGTELLSILSYEGSCKEQGCQYAGELE